MPKTSAAVQELESLISRLQADRQLLVLQLEEIDATFSRFGLTPAAPKRRGRPKGSTAAAPVLGTRKKRRRTRGKFSSSGEQSILDFVSAAGKSGRTGAEIDVHWKKEGRGGSAYNAMGKLVRDRKIKKEKIKDGRGSRYIST